MATPTISRMSVKLDIQIDKGSTFLHTLIWKTGPTGAQTPVDFTDCTAKMQIRVVLTDDTVLHEMTTENGGITLGGAAGSITMYIEDDTSTGFTTWTQGEYEMEIYFPDGTTRRLLRGNVFLFDEGVRP